MTDSELRGQIAVVTGGTRGIGRAVAERLAGSGADVAVLATRPDAAETAAGDLAKAHGVRAFGVGVDVADETSVNAAFERVLETFGRIDVLVNNAGITRDGLVLRMKDEDWTRVLDVNLKGAFHCIRACARPMLKQRSGRIINVTSVIGLIGNAGQANYAASKGGLVSLTMATAKEFAARNVTVNAVAPGFIETEMTGGLKDEVKQSILKGIPVGRFGKADDVASAVRFLAGPGAAYITGQVVIVDGGMSLGPVFGEA